MIPALIDKQDTFEIIRDQIAQIIANETASQQALALAAAEDPELWKLRVYLERTNPWEQFQAETAEDARSPIVNVWYENSTFDMTLGNTVYRQMCDATFNIDCYALGVAKDVVAGGHVPGDQDAALASHRALRLVRNILMSSEYTYLGLRGVVGRRWPQSITAFQPQLNADMTNQVLAARFSLGVRFNEFAPQGDESETLDYVAVDVQRAEDGQVVAEADYDYS